MEPGFDRRTNTQSASHLVRDDGNRRCHCTPIAAIDENPDPRLCGIKTARRPRLEEETNSGDEIFLLQIEQRKDENRLKQRTPMDPRNRGRKEISHSGDSRADVPFCRFCVLGVVSISAISCSDSFVTSKHIKLGSLVFVDALCVSVSHSLSFVCSRPWGLFSLPRVFVPRLFFARF